MGLDTGRGAVRWQGRVQQPLEYSRILTRWFSKHREGRVRGHLPKLFECQRFNIEFPVEILANLTLHLVDLPQMEHILADNAPRLIGVGIIADHLGGNHEGGYEEPMAGRIASSGEPGIQALKQH